MGKYIEYEKNDIISINGHKCSRIRAGMFKVEDKYVVSRAEWEKDIRNVDLRLLVESENRDDLTVKYVLTNKFYSPVLEKIIYKEGLMVIYNHAISEKPGEYECNIDFSKREMIIAGHKCIDEEGKGIYTFSDLGMKYSIKCYEFQIRECYKDLIAICHTSYDLHRDVRECLYTHVCSNKNNYVDEFIDQLNKNSIKYKYHKKEGGQHNSQRYDLDMTKKEIIVAGNVCRRTEYDGIYYVPGEYSVYRSTWRTEDTKGICAVYVYSNNTSSDLVYIKYIYNRKNKFIKDFVKKLNDEGKYKYFTM